MKKFISVIVLIMMLISVIPMSAGAENPDDMSFSFELSVDGKGNVEKKVKTGDVITIMFYLNRTDSDEAYTMYAMQNEIRYDSEFFELVEGSIQIGSKDIRTTDIALRDRHREFYMNYVSMGGGAKWNAESFIGFFQLKVIGTQGVSVITNEDALVSFKDGSGNYNKTVNKLTITISNKCVIKLDPKNGDEPQEYEVKYGKKLPRPENPEKEGYYFAGWYKDIDCIEKWDFDKDVVDENTTLYAKWSRNEADFDAYVPPKDDGTPWGWLLIVLGIFLIIFIIIIIIILLTKKVTFESNGGSPVKSVRVFKGKKIARPENPTRVGYSFVGWAKDEACTMPWFFGKDEVTESMTLYAKWKKD